jgi:hypothetical protein
MHPYRIHQRKHVLSILYDRLQKSEFRSGRVDIPSSRFISDVVEVLTQEKPLSREELLALCRVKMLKCMHAKFKKCAKLSDSIGKETRIKTLRSIRTLNVEIFRLGRLLLRRDSKEGCAAMRTKLRELNASIQGITKC